MEGRPNGNGWRDRCFVMIVSCGGLGLAPIASGTFGTLAGIPLALALSRVPLLPFWLWCVVATLLLLAIGVALGNWAERYFGKKDPGAIVIDEVAGFLVTVAMFDLIVGRDLSFAGYVLAFLLFRLTDIVKPPPARALEKLPGGFGVMIDDIVVAVYSGAVLAGLGSLGFTWL